MKKSSRKKKKALGATQEEEEEREKNELYNSIDVIFEADELIYTSYFPSKEYFHIKSVGISISDYLLSIDFLFIYFIVYYARSQ